MFTTFDTAFQVLRFSQRAFMSMKCKAVYVAKSDMSRILYIGENAAIFLTFRDYKMMFLGIRR